MIDAGASMESGAAHRDSLSRLRSLLVLAQLMMESTNEEQILQLAAGAARSLAPCTWARFELDDDPVPVGELTVSDILDHAGAAGGHVSMSDGAMAWAYPVHSGHGHAGWLVAHCVPDPSDEEHFLLRALAQHAGAAIANRRLHEQEQRAVAEAERANGQLHHTLGVLQRSMEIHARLTAVAASGEGRDGIARAVHDLTGLPVAIEDRFGNLRAWAGPGRPDPYPKQAAARREQLLRRALKESRPIRVEDRWMGVTEPQPDVIAALVLIDPEGTATDQQLTALEHGLTVLAMETARLRSLAESELRVRRDLVEELLAGTDEESALRRAQALRYDLERPHRVVIVEGATGADDGEAFLHTVRRVARDMPVGSLLIRRGAQVVVLADRDTDWNQFRTAILAELRGGRCRVGVGQSCESVSELPRSLRQAESALKVQRAAAWEDQATCYDDLGVFQLLAEVEDPSATEGYVRRWLGSLLEYDTKRNAGLVDTLSRYLECGGNYDETSATLFIHRSTLKYRLQRIREISGYDLNHPDTRFNLQLACRAWETLRALRQN
ncbi:MAG: PucR family transcriptional regulator [Acidimicrobiia bacterium]